MTASRQEGTVYVVDDDPTIVKMLQALVATIGVEVRAFVSAKEFLAAYRPTPYHCLVCDLRMPDIDGMELQKRLGAMAAAPPIIFLTGFAEVSIAVEAMRHGAFDFLEKPFSAHALLGKIQSALDRSRGDYAESLGRQAVEARMALLTPRERSVVCHVVDGKSSREISELLGISVRTVENHRTRIMEKLHVESTVAVVKLFLSESPAR
jgi:two-component system response regulator FixJ